MLKVMSFNLRYGTAKDGANSWEFRKDITIEMLSEYHPDIIGTQEGLKFQLDYITSEIPEYQFFGVSRRGTDEDEFSAIIYDAQKLKLLDGGNFWISETPDVPGSQSWGSSLPRMVTWASFETKDGNSFYQYNTHFDHRSEEARGNGALLIWRETKSHEIPVILTGDFNAVNRGTVWNTFTGNIEYEEEKADFIDAWDVASSRRSDVKVTFHSFMGKEFEKKREEQIGRPLISQHMIDWVLFRGKLDVAYGEIVSYNKDGRYPSDHYPVYIEFLIPEGK